MKKNICPYNKKVICEYLEKSENGLVYECEDCPHYKPLPSKEDPFGGAKTLGCLIVSIALIILGLVVAEWIIQSLRP